MGIDGKLQIEVSPCHLEVHHIVCHHVPPPAPFLQFSSYFLPQNEMIGRDDAAERFIISPGVPGAAKCWGHCIDLYKTQCSLHCPDLSVSGPRQR